LNHLSRKPHREWSGEGLGAQLPAAASMIASVAEDVAAPGLETQELFVLPAADEHPDP
jgi:hypothetical protein